MISSCRLYKSGKRFVNLFDDIDCVHYVPMWVDVSFLKTQLELSVHASARRSAECYENIFNPLTYFPFWRGAGKSTDWSQTLTGSVNKIYYIRPEKTSLSSQKHFKLNRWKLWIRCLFKSHLKRLVKKMDFGSFAKGLEGFWILCTIFWEQFPWNNSDGFLLWKLSGFKLSPDSIVSYDSKKDCRLILLLQILIKTFPALHQFRWRALTPYSTSFSIPTVHLVTSPTLLPN